MAGCDHVPYSEGIDSTLAFIANHSGTGSAVIFDYFTSPKTGRTIAKDVDIMSARVNKNDG